MKKTFTLLTTVCALFGEANAFDLGTLRDNVQNLQQTPRQLTENPALARAIKEVSPPDQREEMAIGRQIAGNLLGAAPLVNDAQLQQYVNLVGGWVASQSERPDLPWHFGVIDSPDVNAFAAPGGYIFITRGLYKVLQNEADLAGVLGHEIAHVVQQHHLKILQKSKLLDAGSRVIISRAGGDQNVQALIGSGAEIVARSLDKDAEFEADRMGVVLTTRAGYDPFGLPNVLQKIGHLSGAEGSVALLFKTHPHPDQRLDKLSVTLGDRFDSIKGQRVSERFYRIK